MRRTVALLVLSALLATACGRSGPSDESAKDRILVRIHTRHGVLKLTDLEVARTKEARERGLMERTSLPEDGGMVFLFDGPATDTFWMKDTLIPLSILFWDRGGRIIDILDMRPCEADPCPVYQASGPYVGAIEMNRGYFREHGVRVGDRLDHQLIVE